MPPATAFDRADVGVASKGAVMPPTTAFDRADVGVASSEARPA